VANPTRSFGYDAAGNTLSDTGLAYTTTIRLDNRGWARSPKVA